MIAAFMESHSQKNPYVNISSNFGWQKWQRTVILAVDQEVVHHLFHG